MLPLNPQKRGLPRVFPFPECEAFIVLGPNLFSGGSPNLLIHQPPVQLAKLLQQAADPLAEHFVVKTFSIHKNSFCGPKAGSTWGDGGAEEEWRE